LIGIFTAHAQDSISETGICDGVICGPSGAFTVVSFPTLTPISWESFPANPPRPYEPSNGGRAIYVSPEGSDQNDGSQGSPLATINTAAAQAQTGDVIWVADGTYALGENTIYEGLILTTPGITLAAEHVGGVTLIPASGDEPPAIAIQAPADNVIIDGFTIQDFRSVGIEFGRGESPQRNLILKHLKITGTEEGIRAAYAGDGTTPIIDGLLVYDVWLRDISMIGMQCGQGPCNNMRWEALRVEMPGEGEGSGADALAVESGDNVVVFNADVSGAAADGIDLKSSRVVVANVIVHDISRNGIKLWNGGDVINALVYNTGADAALVLETGNNYRVLNTIVAHHSRDASAYAMTVAYDSPDQPGHLEIINSVFYENSGAIWISPAFTLDARNNIFYGSANGQELIWGDINIGENDSPISVLEAAGGGAGNFPPTDPYFLDREGATFAWTVGSPLFNSGITIDTLPEFDLYGNPRVVGAGVDLGPIELQAVP
jgi:hypothetical protein